MADEARQHPGKRPVALAMPKPGAGDPRVGFVLRLGRALHTFGYPSHQIEDVMGEIAARLGLTAQFFAQPTSIFAAFGPQDDQHTYLVRFEPGEVHLEKLAAVDAVGRAVLDGTLDPAAATARLEAIVAAPPRYGMMLTMLAAGVSSSAFARFLGGGVREIVIAFAIGLVVGALAIATARVRSTRRVFEPLAAFVASALAASLAHAIGPCSVYVATLAGIVALIPGLTLTIAMTELATRHLVSGTARLSGALVTFLAIAFGVAMGSRVTELLLGPTPTAEPRGLAPWTELAAFAVAPLSLTVLFRAPPRELPWIFATCMAAFFGGRLGARTLGPDLGIFAGALTAGIAANLYARLRGRPASVTIVPAVLLLVPGSIGFRGLALLLEQQVVGGVESAFRMLIMLSALVAGLLIANVVVEERRTMVAAPTI